MKDNFSIQAAEYSKFRPVYPAEMIDYILSFVTDKNEALDVGTGNGQVAAVLSDHFNAVYATDISENQISNAVRRANIHYKIAPAEKTDFKKDQFDLITVAQAIHWFEFDKFYDEVYRILKDDGVFAVLGYGLFSTNDETDKIILEYYRDITGPYWDPERRYLDENYTTIPFPFHELPSKPFVVTMRWSIAQLIGYLGTWSAGQHFKKAEGFDPLDIIRDRLASSWENSDHQVIFNFLLRLGKKIIQ